MSETTILVVEDEEDILELLRYNLSRQGYTVQTAKTGEKGLRQAKADPPHLILLDLMLPGMNGLEVCRALRREPQVAGVPIMMLTAKGEEEDIVAGLEMGADDYMTKPFSPKVLLARVAAVLRRTGRGEPLKEKTLEIHGLSLNSGRRKAIVGGQELDLTFSEFELLRLLATRPGWVFTRNQIVEGIRGDDYPVTERAVDVQIVGLRKKLGEAGGLIETVRGVGYRFRE